MKKFSTILIALVAVLFLLSLSGCGQTSNTTPAKDEITKEAEEINKTADEVNPEDFNPEKLNDLGEV